MNSQPSSTHQKTKKRRTKEEWQALVAGFEDSDLSLAKYCQSLNIAPSGFYNWRKRFEAEAAESPAFIEMLTPTVSDIPVSSMPSPSDWRLELSLGNGMILRVR